MYDVTIGIPVYKSERYIGRTLTSALSQTYPSIEFIVIDDRGGDSSMDIISSIKNSHQRGADIRVITNSLNLGVSASRNRIIEEARGKYLFFMDSDDEIAPNTIELLMKNILLYNAEIAFGSYEKITIGNNHEIYRYPSLQFFHQDELAFFAYRKYAGIQASACNYLIEVSLLRKYQLRFIDTNYWEDFVFTFNLVTYISRAVLLPDITYYYYCRENSLSHYQSRPIISKDEINKNVQTIEYLKETSKNLYDKAYFPCRCYLIMMTDFYIACQVLKRYMDIVPSVSYDEIRLMMRHPASLRQICLFRQARLKNLLFYILGRLPAFLCVKVVKLIGKMKKLI